MTDGKLIVPERPAYPFLVDSQASAAAGGPEAPSSITYRISLAFISSALLQGKAFILGWRQGSTAREIAGGLRAAADALDRYAGEVEQQQAATEAAANDSEQAATPPGHKGNGTGQPQANPGRLPDG